MILLITIRSPGLQLHIPVVWILNIWFRMKNASTWFHTLMLSHHHVTHQPESNVTYSQHVSLPCPVLSVIMKLCELKSNAGLFFFFFPPPVHSSLFERTTDGGQTLTVARPSVPPPMLSLIRGQNHIEVLLSSRVWLHNKTVTGDLPLKAAKVWGSGQVKLPYLLGFQPAWAFSSTQLYELNPQRQTYAWLKI